MAFNIVVGINVNGTEKLDKATDATDDLATSAKSTTAALGQMGTAGAAAGEQLADGTTKARTALDDLADAIKGAAGASTQFGGSTSGANEFTLRQLQILQQIHGPAREWAEDLKALNELNKLGAITVQQYEDQLVRAQQAYGVTEGAEAAYADTLRKEAQLYEQITGPLRQYEQDLVTLEGLLKKGQVTLDQYDSQLAKVQRRAESAGVLAPKMGPAFDPNQAGRGLSEELVREQKILESLQAPLHEYEAQLKALQKLLADGRIEQAAYDRELEKAQAIAQRAGVIGPVQGPVQQAAGGAAQTPEDSNLVGSASNALGMAGSLLTGGVVGGAIIGLGESVQHLIDKFHELQDTWIEATNVALKFTDAAHSTNLIIDEQIRLAHELHSTEKATIEIYDSVRDGTDDLNISHQDQIRLVKTLGEAVQLAGKSMESAGGVVTRLSYALARGKIEVLEMQRIMKEVPELGDLWTKSFDTNRLGLLAMVREGKIGVEDIVNSLVHEGKFLDDNFAKRQRTNKQREEEWMLNEKLYSQRYDVSFGAGHAAHDTVEAFKNNAEQMQTALTGSGPLRDLAEIASKEKLDEQKAALQELFDNLFKLQGPFQKIGDTYRKMTGDTAAVRAEVTKLNEPVEHARSELETLNKAFEVGKIDLDTYRKRWAELQTTIGRGIGSQALKITEPIRIAKAELDRLMNDIEAGADITQAQLRKAYAQAQATIKGFMPEDLKLNNPKLDAKDQLADLTRAWKEGQITAESYRREYDALMTTINDGRLPETIKFWEQVHLPQQQFIRDNAALDALLARGAITLSQYTAELWKLREALDDTGFTKMEHERHDAFVREQAAIERYMASRTTVAQDAARARAQEASEKHQDTLIEPAVESVRIYEQALQEIDAATQKWNLSQNVTLSLQLKAREAFDSSAESFEKLSNRAEGYMAALQALQAKRNAGARDDGTLGLSDEQFQHSVLVLDRAAKVVESYSEPLSSYNDKVEAINIAVRDLGLTHEKAAVQLRKVQLEYRAAEEALTGIKGPQEQYNLTIKHLDDQLRNLEISQSKYTDSVAKAKEQLLTDTGKDKTFLGGLEMQWIKLQQEADRLGATLSGQLIGNVDKLNEALTSMANGGEVSWSNMADAMIQDLERIALKMLELKLISAGIALFSSGAGSASGLEGTNDTLASLGYANGGSFIVGGSGPPDSKMFNLRLTPGEMVSVRTPGQQRETAARATAPQSPPVVHIHNHYDSSVTHAAMDDPRGQKSVINTLRLNPGAARNVTSRPRRA